MQHAQAQPPFVLDLPLNRPLRAMVGKPLEKMLCLPTLNSLYARIGGREAEGFPGRVLDLLGVAVDAPEADLARIPATGPAVVVANHPFGAIEGVVLLQALLRVRPDVKIMANSLLALVPELRGHLITVDPFGSRNAARRNIAPLKEAIRWARGGGLLAVFPAGEVSSLQLRKRAVTDPDWSPTVGRIIRISGAPAVPVYFDGANGPLFHLMGLIHPRLRTVMLPRELLNKRSRTVRLGVGRPVPAQKIARFASDEQLTQYLRLRTYVLGQRCRRDQGPAGVLRALAPRPAAPRALPAPAMTPVAPPCDRAALAREIAAQPAPNVLLEQGDYVIVCAQGRYLPTVLPELGRLREIAFREVGEGTGRARDIDRYDDYYHHLVLWNRAAQEIVGAYRLGRADIIAGGYGPAGLYTHSLFDYDQRFLERISPALELGRAFVTAEYRKSYNPLLLLWKGIAAFVSRERRYRLLFGPVSISNDYHPCSKLLMMRFLRANHAPEGGLHKLIRPRTPPRLRARRPGGLGFATINTVCPDIEDLASAISDIEADGKGIPVLLRQYLKLGGTVLTFNRDPDFGDAIDGLMLVDLAHTPPKTLERFMGRDEAAMFLAAHGQ